MKLGFFEGDRLLGVGFIDYPVSEHYMCPYCGTIWGSEICLDPERDTRTHVHHCSSVPCPEHIDKWRSLPIFSTLHRSPWLVVTIPKEVLVRDFLLVDSLSEEP